MVLDGLEFHSHELDDINPVRLYEIALEKALASESPEAITEGEYTVILEPPAVASLIRFLGYLGLVVCPSLKGDHISAINKGKNYLMKRYRLQIMLFILRVLANHSIWKVRKEIV